MPESYSRYLVTDVGSDTSTTDVTSPDEMFRMQILAHAWRVFEARAVLFPRFLKSVIDRGLGCEFPAIAEMAAADHHRGEELGDAETFQKMIQVEINYHKTSHAYIADMDARKASWDVTGTIGAGVGAALVKSVEMHYMWTLLTTAINITHYTTSKVFTFDKDDNVQTLGTPAVTTPTAKDAVVPTPDELAEGAFNAAAILQTRGMDLNDVTLYLNPKAYSIMLRSSLVSSRDMGGTGSVGTGQIMMLHGMPVVACTTFPTGDEEQDDPTKADYPNPVWKLTGMTADITDRSKIIGVVAHKAAIHGCHYPQLISVEMARVAQRLTTLVVGKLSFGVEPARLGGAIALLSHAAL